MYRRTSMGRRNAKRMSNENKFAEDDVPVLNDALSMSIPPTLTHKYWCGCCNFSAKTPSSFRNHLYSTRHYRNWSKEASVSDASMLVKGNKIYDDLDIKCMNVASNDIIHLLDECSDMSSSTRSSKRSSPTLSGTEPELSVSELDDSDSADSADSASADSDIDSANASESEEDIDLPLYGTGLFYPDGSQSVRSANNRVLKEEKSNDIPDPLLIATAFVLGMIVDRCVWQFVYNVCVC